MNRIAILCMAAMMAGTGLAAKPENLTAEEKEAKRAAAKERMMQMTGGLVEKAGEGRIVIVNRQRKIADGSVRERVDTLKNVIRVNIELVADARPEGGLDVAKLGVPEGAQAAMYVVDDPSLPMSLVAAEAGWGVLNVNRLDKGKRFKTEFNRVATMTFGAGVSQFKGSTMQTVRGPADLDKLMSEGFTFDAVSTMMRNLQNVGVTQTKRSTYKKACEEGWAAEPVDSYQRAIWEKVKAEQSEQPSNPLKIKPGDKPKK